MLEARRRQLHFGEGLIAEEVSDLREEWMRTPTECSTTNNLFNRYELWRGVARKAVRAGGAALRRKWFYACCYSSISVTGATRCWNAKSAPTWCIAISHG